MPSEPSAPRLYHPRPRDPADGGEAARRDLAAELNEAQAAAATHDDGPLLVIAGAGTGKTRTLVYRVAHLIERGVRAERILLLTFTRRAAQEMLGRVERLVGAGGRQVHGGTFHATAHRLLRRFGASAGLPSDFTIMDQGDAEDLMQLSRAQLGLGDKKRRFPKKETLHYLYSRHVNTEVPVEDILRDEYPAFVDDVEDVRRVFADYTSRKGDRNLVDYDDLLLFWAALLEASPELGARIAGLYDHVLVDEYQDTNVLQARILRGMCQRHRNVTVVGDDAQSIYSFRGASFRNILDFPAQYPGTTVVTLEQNYRSTQPILDATNALIARAPERFTKNLWTERAGGEAPWLVAARDERQQTAFVVDRVLELHEDEGVPLREIAVLFRAGYMSADLEIELTNRKIPFEKWGGLKFLEAAHVKDVLAFLRVLENPRDEVSWYRALLLLPGVGDATARAAIATLAADAWDPEAFSRFKPPARAREAHERLCATLRELRRRRVEPAAISGDGGDGGDGGATAARADPRGSVSVEIARIRAFYDAILREKYDKPEPRLADLDQLQTIAAGYPSRAAFLSALALEPPSATQDLAGGAGGEDDVLVLSTAHSAKGKEWDAVFLIWAVDGFFPSGRALDDDDETEEERRLMYVALTRARDHLSVVYPLNSYGSRRGADYTIDQLSRFLDRDVRARMQRVTLAEAEPPAAPPPPPNMAPALDLRALLRGRFGAK
ncbi:MAG TPA: ATP-dependent helicase [Gemmatimonadaceae bacterium]|nr:ATP-dependent helicase [Gemmatimonadaceae bacterium]